MNLTWFKNKLPALLFVFVFFMDVVQTQILFYSPQKFFPSFLAKFCLLIFFLIVSFKENRRYLLLIGLLFLFFLIGQLTLSQFEIEALRMTGMFFNYTYIFILIFGFNRIVNTEEKIKNLQKAFLFVIGLVLVSMVIGSIFDINSFKTYYYRFGYKGILNKSSDASYFLMIVFIYIQTFKKQIARYKLFLATTFLCCVLVGTKAPWLFFLLAFSIGLWTKKLKINKKYFLASLVILPILIVLVYLLFKKIIDKTMLNFYKLYEDEGIWAVITSKRSTKFTELFAYYKNDWNFLNYLFGGKYGHILSFEYAFFDMLIMFGLIGFALYCALYYKIVIKSFSNFPKYLLYTMIFVAIVVGQFFINTNMALFLSVLVILQRKNHIGLS
ncbi:O-antigen ligase family protein [Marixanthomonas ophiurae]|uniref:O-antigen ligase domain-containing protein n=1 Tax=Marixanthomonas ophiurae TaxID=387659 RepID=A0A3E1QAI8_9FLAO|nr:O-antigen ligase family protein [Marixanthomonas ophiurae]RFN59159.1 hypothetical protein DZ858_03535 [Marixanthomonas ophiurae]